MSKTIEDKAQEFAEINEDKECNYSFSYNKYDIANAFQNGGEFGYALAENRMKKEYEWKLRWIPIYEPPKTAELVIVDSDNDLHACVAVAFIENGTWKYANGQLLWFTPRRWRSFL